MKCTFLFGLGCVAALWAQEQSPTSEDLKTMIDEWQRMVTPGQILKVAPKTPLIFNRSDLEKIADAKKIGDDQGMIAELVKKEQAVIIETETEVRLLDKFWGLCFAFFTLNIPCQDSIPLRLQDQFSDLTAPPGAKLHYDRDALPKTRERFLKHDLSSWVEGHYLQVRVVGGKHDAMKGWIRMSEARYPVENAR